MLHEINFGVSRSAKSAILTHLEALNFDFYEYLHFLEADIYQILKWQKTAFLKLLDPLNLTSHNI